MKLDILIVMAHPDDAELSCSGTIISSVSSGKKVGIIDLTKGEMGTRGNSKIRISEANDSAKLMKIKFRENLGLKDAFFENNEKNKLLLVKKIREYRPKIIITNSFEERHPDHEKASRLVYDASFLSGLEKVSSKYRGKIQKKWKPNFILYSLQDKYIKPDFVIDVSKFYNKKIKAIKCFKSQFYNNNSKESESYISTKNFLDFINSRSIELGHSIGVNHGEGFISSKSNIGFKDLFSIL